MHCSSCGLSWEVRARPDGSMPQMARCPKALGGCGAQRRVPSSGRASGVPAAGAGWEPAGGPRAARQVAERCPDCDGPLLASPRGTIRVCPGCRRKVTPAGVLTPYERGGAVVRQVKSQREADLEALDLAGRKGVMLGQLRDLAEGDRLDDASRLKAEWFAEQVKTAPNAARLDELAALFTEARIRPRRWWHPRPAALATADYDDEDEYPDGYDNAEDGQDDEPAAVVPATPASIAAHQHRAQPRRMTWADAITASGWRLSPTVGGCQIIDEHGLCGADTMHHIGDGWLCSPHYTTLGGVITRDYYRRSA